MTKPHVSLLVVTSHKPKSHVILTAGKNLPCRFTLTVPSMRGFFASDHGISRKMEGSCEMKIMAIDYGDARTGVAFSDISGSIAGETLVVEDWNAGRLAEKLAEL